MISHTFNHELHVMKEDYQTLDPDRRQAVLGLLHPPTITETLNCWKAANNRASVLEEFFEHIITEFDLKNLLISSYDSAEPTFEGKTLEAKQCIPRLSQENS